MFPSGNCVPVTVLNKLKLLPRFRDGGGYYKYNSIKREMYEFSSQRVCERLCLDRIIVSLVIPLRESLLTDCKHH